MLGVIALNLKTSALNTRNGMRGHRGRFISSPLSAGGIEPNLPRRSDAGRRQTATPAPPRPTRDRRGERARRANDATRGRTRARARRGPKPVEKPAARIPAAVRFLGSLAAAQRAAPRRGPAARTRHTSERVNRVTHIRRVYLATSPGETWSCARARAETNRQLTGCRVAQAGTADPRATNL